ARAAPQRSAAADRPRSHASGSRDKGPHPPAAKDAPALWSHRGEPHGASNLRVRASMGHQRRHGHRLQDAAGDAAQNEFAQPRMAIASHDDEVGPAFAAWDQTIVAPATSP